MKETIATVFAAIIGLWIGTLSLNRYPLPRVQMETLAENSEDHITVQESRISFRSFTD